jgi:hypothetical protein
LLIFWFFKIKKNAPICALINIKVILNFAQITGLCEFFKFKLMKLLIFKNFDNKKDESSVLFNLQKQSLFKIYLCEKFINGIH